MFKQKAKRALTLTVATALVSAVPFTGIFADTNSYAFPTTESSVEHKNNKTEAGSINFDVLNFLDKNQPIYQQIVDSSESKKTITFKNGSIWKVSNIESVKGWENSKHLVLTQNHAIFSTYKFALINQDLGLAEPVSLIKAPFPNGKHNLFIESLSTQVNAIKLNNKQIFVVQAEDNGSLKGFHENNLILLGANTSDKDARNPYIIIDVSLNSNDYVRAALKN